MVESGIAEYSRSPNGVVDMQIISALFGDPSLNPPIVYEFGKDTLVKHADVYTKENWLRSATFPNLVNGYE